MTDSKWIHHVRPWDWQFTMATNNQISWLLPFVFRKLLIVSIYELILGWFCNCCTEINMKLNEMTGRGLTHKKYECSKFKPVQSMGLLLVNTKLGIFCLSARHKMITTYDMNKIVVRRTGVRLVLHGNLEDSKVFSSNYRIPVVNWSPSQEIDAGDTPR